MPGGKKFDDVLGDTMVKRGRGFTLSTQTQPPQIPPPVQPPTTVAVEDDDDARQKWSLWVRPSLRQKAKLRAVQDKVHDYEVVERALEMYLEQQR